MQLNCSNSLTYETFIPTICWEKPDDSREKIRERVARVYLFFRDHYDLNKEFNRPTISVEPIENSTWSCKINWEREGKHLNWYLKHTSVSLEEIALAYLRASLPSSGLAGEAGALSRSMPIILGIVFKRSLDESNWLIDGNDLSEAIDMHSLKVAPPTIQGSRILNHAFYQAVEKAGKDYLMTISKIWLKIFLGAIQGMNFETFACLTITFARTNYPDYPELTRKVQRSWLEVGILKLTPSF